MVQHTKCTVFASCPKGLEGLLLEELQQLGVDGLQETVGGVYGESDFANLYRICLHSRLANRLVWVLAQGRAENKEAVYDAVASLSWPEYFALDKTFAVHFSGTNRVINHSKYGALLVKDAVVDNFYKHYDKRPDVSTRDPDVQLYAHVRREKFLVGIDVSGFSLHRRNYRLDGAKAPLKENLAAALIRRTNYTPDDERLLLDPMCGSGTLLIEGVMQRLNIASGLLREHFGFEHLLSFDQNAWENLRDEALDTREKALLQYRGNLLACGYDQDQRMIEAANANVQRAGLQELITFKHQSLKDWPQEERAVLLVCNPPYGERLDERDTLFPTYQLLGEKIRQNCQDSTAWVLCSDDYLLKAMRLSKSKAYRFYNGAIAVQWVSFDIYKKPEVDGKSPVVDERFQQAVQMVENRLKKNRKKLQKWQKQQQIECYRLYDADMPEYAFALDCYGEQYHIAEYAPPKTVDAFAAYQRRLQFEQAVKNVFSLKQHQLIFKQRKPQKGDSQYQKLDEQKNFFTVQEGPAQLWVNLTDYLDTGLFLDHRPLRLQMAERAKGKHFLNLFCYTAAVTVHAALAGAESSLSIDMSQTYLNWAQRNFRKNRLDEGKHQVLRADVLQWLRDPGNKTCFDLIFLDPPSFSNSKRMQDVLDVQRDHLHLIEQTMALLADDGVLIFSNNRRGFSLDNKVLEQFAVENITKQTVGRDFERSPTIHQCWRIRHETDR